MRVTISIISLCLVLTGSALKGQEGYNIKFRVQGNENSFISIAYHLGDKQYIKDTLTTDQSGNASFSGSEKLEQGLYMVVMPDNSYFEMIMPDDQEFEVTCSSDDFAGTLSFSGSPQNEEFLKYQKGWKGLQERAMAVRKRIESNRERSDSLEYLYGLQSDAEKEMMAYLRTVSERNKGTILAALLNSMLPVEIPEFEIAVGTRNPDSVRWVMSYNYNALHYFDNTDLTDERLVRTPVLYNKVNNFFSNVIIQHPDTIISEMNRVIELSEPDPVVFRFIIVYLFNHFRESQIMGHDAILVELADRYYLSGRADWVSDEFKKDLAADVEKLRNNLIGKKAADLTMEAFDGTWKSLYDMDNEFVILYFWEPDCGHCKVSTPLLRDIYSRLKPTGVGSICCLYTGRQGTMGVIYCRE
ncbi:MAG: DUF5106 domain-containing protein [Bacteroidales bacterium]